MSSEEIIAARFLEFLDNCLDVLRPVGIYDQYGVVGGNDNDILKTDGSHHRSIRVHHRSVTVFHDDLLTIGQFLPRLTQVAHRPP